MGSSLSSPIDDAKQARMKEIIQEVVGVFAKNFPLAYKDALISKIKDEAQPEEESPNYLLDPPVPSAVLKTGKLNKRGDSYKNWKDRHFIAYNQQDNFKVEYYESENGKLKGTIHLCGYRPHHYTTDEARENNCEFGIKLVPNDDRRRTWWLKCSSAEDRSDWMNVFQTGCYKADPPINKDPLIANAFRVAYRATRWSYGYYGWYWFTGTEAECLGLLVSEILDREVLRDVYDSIPAGPTRSSMIAMVRSTVDATIMASVGAAWNAGLSACESMKSALESAVKAAIGPVFEAEVDIKRQVTEKVSGKINPFLTDVGGKVCTPFFKVVATPFTKAFCSTVKGVHKQLKERIGENTFKPDVLDEKLMVCTREVTYWWSGPLEETNRLCYELYNGKLSEIAAMFGDFSTYDLYNMVLEKNRQLAFCAIYTFGARLKESEGSINQERLLNEIIAKMLHDAKIYESNIIQEILLRMLNPQIATNVTTPCTELVAPIQSVIDALPGIGEFFNLTSMLEDIINDVVSGGVAALVEAGYGDVEKQINAAGGEIGIEAAV